MLTDFPGVRDRGLRSFRIASSITRVISGGKTEEGTPLAACGCFGTATGTAEVSEVVGSTFGSFCVSLGAACPMMTTQAGESPRP